MYCSVTILTEVMNVPSRNLHTNFVFLRLNFVYRTLPPKNLQTKSQTVSFVFFYKKHNRSTLGVLHLLLQHPLLRFHKWRMFWEFLFHKKKESNNGKVSNIQKSRRQKKNTVKKMFNDILHFYSSSKKNFS